MPALLKAQSTRPNAATVRAFTRHGQRGGAANSESRWRCVGIPL